MYLRSTQVGHRRPLQLLDGGGVVVELQHFDVRPHRRVDRRLVPRPARQQEEARRPTHSAQRIFIRHFLPFTVILTMFP